MRELLIAGNWKMNCTVDEAVALASALRENLGSVVGVEVAVCPPYVDLVPLRELLGDTAIRLGAQDAFYLDSGAYTGAVSPAMLAPLCQYVIVGHSERRQFFGETDDVVARKVAAVAQHRIDPILCVGETLAEFEAGETLEVLERQLTPVLAAIEPLATLVVAYEPVWAIGTGRSAEASSVNQTIAEIRGRLRSEWGEVIADGIRILYGGSVNAGNIADYVRMEEIDGALVGGASLRAREFCDIVFRSASVRR
jgi:triosephosphate isomerase (TIM)